LEGRGAPLENKNCSARRRREEERVESRVLRGKPTRWRVTPGRPSLLGWRGGVRPSRTAPLEEDEQGPEDEEKKFFNQYRREFNQRRRRREEEEEENEIFNHYKNDSERHEHTVHIPRRVAGADLKSQAGGLAALLLRTGQPPGL